MNQDSAQCVKSQTESKESKVGVLREAHNNVFMVELFLCHLVSLPPSLDNDGLSTSTGIIYYNINSKLYYI